MLYAFLGPNGAGKTTSLRMFAGLLRPDAGDGALGTMYENKRLRTALFEAATAARHVDLRMQTRATDVVRGVVNENAPIALEMLGAAVGDEIDVVNKRYRVLKIARPT